MTILCLVAVALMVTPALAQAPSTVPVFQITPEQSTIKFNVEASVAIVGTFDKWKASLIFASPEAESAAFDVKIYADSVDTGGSIKNNKLKSADFFDVQNHPYITFRSTKVVQTGPNTFEPDGNFTIRGVTRQEHLMLTLSGREPGRARSKEQWPSIARTTG